MSHETTNGERARCNVQLRSATVIDRCYRRELGRFLLGLRFALKRALRLLHNRFEGRVVGDREIGENLAIEADPGRLQPFCETAVSHAVGARGGIKTLDPKIAKCAFARLTITIGPILAFHGRVFGVTEKYRTASAVTFRFLQ